MKKLLILILSVMAGLHSLSAQIQKDTSVQITLMGVPPGEQTRVSSTYPVDGDGNIRMWKVGTIRAAGLSSTALAQKIEKAYVDAQIYTSPRILIATNDVTQQLQQIVTVTGAVNRQGTVPFIKGMTLAQAIAGAGGASTFGTTKRVSVYREGKKYDLSPREKDEHKLERIYPDDTIEVGKVKPWETGGS